jgi:hypothetical protein
MVSWLSFIVQYLVGGMKQIVCAIMYYVLYWIWTFVGSALSLCPDWLINPSTILIGEFTNWWKFLDMFAPLSECMVILVGYWGMMLAMRMLQMINSIRKL